MSRAPSPAGCAPACVTASQTAGRGRGGDDQLDAVLAGVARAADEHAVLAGDGQRRRLEAPGQLAVGDPGDDAAGLGALDGEHREVVQAVGQLDVEALGLLAEPGEVALVVARVGDGQEAIAQAIGEEVVEHPAVVLAEHGVLGAAVLQLGHVVGQDPLQERLGVGAARLDLAHVGDVEDARAAAHGLVLGADPLVLHGHLPARERHEPRAGRDVAVVQGRALKGVGHQVAGR